jgi:hypothetical protein
MSGSEISYNRLWSFDGVFPSIHRVEEGKKVGLQAAKQEEHLICEHCLSTYLPIANRLFRLRYLPG